MRYIVLLLLSSFGIFLLFLARNRYEAVNLKLAGDRTVQASLSSILANGDLTLKYTVDAADYEIVRSVPVNFFPRIRAGSPVPLLFSADRPDAARVRHWSVIYQDSAVCGAFGLVALALAMGAFVTLGTTPKPATTTRYPPPAAAVSLNRAIELRNTRRNFVSSLAVALGVFTAAFLLYRNPYFLWTPWLSYPAAAVVAVIGIFMVWGAFFERSIRIRADRDGVVVTDSDGSRKFVWEEVAVLKRETMTQQVRHKSAITHNTSSDYWYSVSEVGHAFILLGKSGQVLLKLDEDTPMEPLQDWLTLRAFIPQRTNLPVVQETTKSPLGQRDAL
ncbi:MAG TPA: hypothetical protein VHW09_17120 [Bryobacteraceae bacterium]|jgi:hypothetical protein|nr:hypothetical protein [Bryobacteraceae bacterium]